MGPAQFTSLFKVACGAWSALLAHERFDADENGLKEIEVKCR